jgi:uracil-DNA glycosylase family 4
LCGPAAPRTLPRPAIAAASPARGMDVALPIVPSLFDATPRVEGDSLERIREDIGDCKRCRLCEARNKIVFGDGSPTAQLVFVGEGPGHDEDVQGLPFVGRAGKLLNQMIEAMGLRREDVYICNIVKCRPPQNRQPERDEVATCSPFLDRQLAVLRPKAIVCLGNVAAQTLLGTNKSISQFRGQWFDFRGTKMLATYHPAFLLRTPSAKSEVWTDLKKVRAELGLKPPEPLPVTLVLALPRPKVLRRVLFSASAMGVKRIFLVNSYRVEKSFWQSPVLGGESIRKQLILGLEQARDTILPCVFLRNRFKPFVEDELPDLSKETLQIVAHPAAPEQCPRSAGRPVTLAIGPEGGFITYEIERLISIGFSAVNLGERILPVETAVPFLISRLF